MSFIRESLERFLECLNPSTNKGFILHLHLNGISLPDFQEKVAEIKKLFEILQKNKKCQLLYTHDPFSFFVYFPENSKDEISASLVKTQFTLGSSLNSNLNDHNSFYKLYQPYHWFLFRY